MIKKAVAILPRIRIKDMCQSSVLPEKWQEVAEKAHINGTLSLLDGELSCECGASVGAVKSREVDGYGPTRHSVKQSADSDKSKSKPATVKR